MKRRPSAADLAAAGERTIPDVIDGGLAVLFCGINPGRWSGALSQHFARPGNRFWPTLHRSRFTPRELRPEEQNELLSYGVGVTNLVPRTTARTDELTRDELISGATRLSTLVADYEPAWVVVLGRDGVPAGIPTSPGQRRPVAGVLGDRRHLGTAQPERSERSLPTRCVGRRVRATV